MASKSRRACPACTLLCADTSRISCELCGTPLPHLGPSQTRSTQCISLDDAEDEPIASGAGPSTTAGRACPACTFICEDLARLTCEMCDTRLPPVLEEKTVTQAESPASKRRRLFGAMTLKLGKEELSLETEEASKVADCAVPASSSWAPCASEAQVTWQASQESTAHGVPPDDLAADQLSYRPEKAGWKPKEPVPYRHLAAALDALEATRSRLTKDLVLTNAFRAMLVLEASADDIEAACYLFAPAKDPQSGGHRLRPDWQEGARPLSIPRGSITSALLNATNSSRAHLTKLYNELHELGEVAMALRERGGRQVLLVVPRPLILSGVRSKLLSLAEIQGTGAEKQKTDTLTGLLRAAKGTELKWLTRTLLPHMAAGISLEASVLPALGAAWLLREGRSVSPEKLKEAQDAVRTGFALRPDVRALVDALLRGGPAEVERACTLHLGVPMQPMLAKACTSVPELLKRIAGVLLSSPSSMKEVNITAESKYDGQRAQIHRDKLGEIKIFSRKIDDMTYKYPDVVEVIKRCSQNSDAFVLDAEIVAVMPTPQARVIPEEGEAGEDDLEGQKSGAGLAAFQSLSTRKRKNVTATNAAAVAVAVKVFLFDLLLKGDELLLHRPLFARREALYRQFQPEGDVLAFAHFTDIDVQIGETTDAEAEKALEKALRQAVAASCEGLMVKRLDSPYEPSTKRSDCWLKLKKDYLDSLGDSLDLIPIGGWRGSGRKSKWISPWLMATYDPTNGTLGSVCRVMSGFTDQFYKDNTIRFLGKELEVKRRGDASSTVGSELEGEAEAEASEGEAEAGLDGGEGESADDDDICAAGILSAALSGKSLLRQSPAAGVETLEKPMFWFQPVEVWEIRGADITVSPKHMAARGLVDKSRGLSLRFPRFIRKREDKNLQSATTPQQLASLFQKQTQQR